MTLRTDGSDGGAAYPRQDDSNFGEMGMSLRDYFAGQALAGAMSTVGNVDYIRYHVMAKDCYDAADAMIVERNK